MNGMLKIATAWAILLAAWLPAHAGQREGYARLGELRLSYTPGSGLGLWRQGEPLAVKSSAAFHDGHWQHMYYSLPHELAAVAVESAAASKTLRVSGGPRDGMLSVEQTITAHADGSLRIELQFELKTDVPMSVEYCTLQFSTAPLVGCPFTTKAKKLTTGTVPFVCAGPNAMLARGAREFTVESRLGTITFRTDEGEPWLDVLDGRKRSWADPQNPILWIGALSRKVLPHVKQRLGLTVSFGKPSAEPPVKFQLAGKPAAPVAVADLVAPTPTPAAPLIPAPKQVKSLPGAFTVRAATPIVIGAKAKNADRRAAGLLQRELADNYGLKLPIKTSAEVQQPAGAIVLGEPGLNPLVAAACRAAGNVPTAKDPGPEGYVLTASPTSVVVAGSDQRGTYWGVQTLLQLLRPAGAGTMSVAGVSIRDWPDFAMRAVHWGIRGKETGLQRRMIERVLARYKVNTLFLECESIGWASHPELNPTGISPAEVADLVRYANEHFIEVIPQVQSLGHCEYWLLGKHPELAENPAAPYNYCPSNPDTYRLLFDLYREVETMFHPRYVHIGHDELNNDFGICPRCKGQSPARLFADEVRRLRDYWSERRVPIMLWSDMLLASKALPCKLDACNGGPPLNVADALPLLPKDVIICDWHYGEQYVDYPSLELFRRAGLKTVATPWYRLGNIWNFTRAARPGGALGVMGSTWCGVDGPERDAESLVRSLKYLYPLVYTADCMWNVGQRAPDAIPYDPAERFLTAVNAEPACPEGKPRAGFLVDLAPYATRSLADRPDSPGWLGYGPERDLSGFPTGRVRLAGTEFLLAARQPKAVMLWGTYAGKARLPREVQGIAINKAAAELRFLHVCGWSVTPKRRVGTYRVIYGDGSREEIPLVAGGNIAEPTCPLPLTSARTAWEGRMADGTTVRVYEYAWRNPHPERTIAAIDFLSAGTHASPTLLGLSVVGP